MTDGPADAGTLTSTSLFCKTKAGTPTFKLAIYDNNARRAGNKIQDSSATTLPRLTPRRGHWRHYAEWPSCD
jgi:hypothetical protein